MINLIGNCTRSVSLQYLQLSGICNPIVHYRWKYGHLLIFMGYAVYELKWYRMELGKQVESDRFSRNGL